MFKKIIFSLALMIFVSSASVQAAPQKVTAPQKAAPQKTSLELLNKVPEINASSLEVVRNPNGFLNKKVVMTVKFDKFSTLGLDYKKAMRDSQKYIGFLIQRDDVKDHNIPLSEMKLFITRDYAEKFIDLNTGDKIKIKGKVFSTALGDPWIDVESIEVIEKTPVAKTN